jgi:hypothetical protein
MTADLQNLIGQLPYLLPVLHLVNFRDDPLLPDRLLLLRTPHLLFLVLSY